MKKGPWKGASGIFTGIAGFARGGSLLFVPEGLALAHLSNLTGEAARPPPGPVASAGASRSVDNVSCNNRRMAEPRRLRPSAMRTVIVPFFSRCMDISDEIIGLIALHREASTLCVLARGRRPLR